MATKKFNSISEIAINDIHAHNIETLDKDATFVYVVIMRYYEHNNRGVGVEYIEGIYSNENDALQYMLNRINRKAEKNDLRDIQVHEEWQVDFHYELYPGEIFRHVWRVDRMPVRHTL